MDDQAALLTAIIARPEDEASRLVYADWLEEHGDPHQARYIRARCALDGKPPGDDYADQFERFQEAEACLWRRPGPNVPRGLSFYHACHDAQWWSDDADSMAAGLPSKVAIDRNVVKSAADIVRALGKLVTTTPVRGIDLEWHFPNEMGTILNSGPARHLRSVTFSSRPVEGHPCPVLAALASSPVARNLDQLRIHVGVQSDPDAEALAAAPFDRLRRLDVPCFRCSAPSVGRLMTAPWFRRLQRLLAGVDEESGVHLANMADLHTLCLWIPSDGVFPVLARRGGFPALRRLMVHCADLRGRNGVALGRLPAPQVMELWLRNAAVNRGDVEALVASPLFDGLRVVTFDGLPMNAAGLHAFAKRPCAAELRILRVRDGRFHSLAKTALTRPGVFPALTTLTLDHPYPSRVKQKDTAEFLRRLATPRLRHLTLEHCDFDDECAAALAANPALADLTRLVIEWGTLGREGAERLFRSPNLRNLIELKVGRCPVGKAAGVLADDAVMPGLGACWLSDCQVPHDVANELKSKRPVVLAS